MSDEKLKITRRGFVKGAGVLTGAAALLGDTLEASAAAGQARKLGPGAVPIELTVNGERHRLAVEPRTTLASVLRDDLGLTGTKIGCDRGACGACTVMMADQPVPSCSVFALDAVGHPVTTIEGLAQGEQLAPIQAAFVAHDALQCGFCTPGMVMSCHALLQRNRDPSEAEVRQAVSGNLCRCGTYPKVFEAALAAAGTAPMAAGVAQGELPKGSAGTAPAPEKGEPPKKQTFQVGVGSALEARERQVPESEPPPWDGRAQLRVVGKPTPRIDGPEKVTGRS